jgi:uncharacterized membrane protein
MYKEMPQTTRFQSVCRIILGLFLALAGTGHLTFSRQEFQAQVPPWLPFNADLVVVLSGVFEILLGLSLIFALRQRVVVGWIAAIFFCTGFSGQYSATGGA